MHTLLTVLGALWRWWSREYISVKLASVYLLLLSAIFFLLGVQRAPADYRHLEQQLEDAQTQVRSFANEIARRNGIVNNMIAKENINKKTLALLNGRIDALEQQSVRWQEETAFYRHVLENKTPGGGDIIIHALDASPDFDRQGWKLSAILARPGKRKAFDGSYYFEVVEATDDGRHTLTRLPAEGGQPFTMEFYHEIEELVNLSPDSTIENLRVVILNKKGENIASVELGSRENENGGDDSNGVNGSGGISGGIVQVRG